MPNMILLSSIIVLGFAVILSYVLVLGNIFNNFDIGIPNSGYLNSAYWLGMSRNNVISIGIFQILAIVGYVCWIYWICTENSYGDSILRFPTVKVVSIISFFIGAVAWPYAAFVFMIDKTPFKAILCCSTLWISAVANIIMMAGTFEANAPSYAVVGIVSLGTVVILIDGIGWSSLCIQTAMYQ